LKNFIKHISGNFINNNLELKFSCKITATGSMKATELLKILRDQFDVPIVVEQADIERTDLYAVNAKGAKKALIKN